MLDGFDGLEFVDWEDSESPCMDKLNRLDWIVHRSFELNGETFGVRTNSREMGIWLDRALGEYRTDERTTPYYSIYVAPQTPTGAAGIKRFHVMYRGTIAAVRSFGVDALRRTFLDELETFLAPTRKDAVFLHATLVRIDGVDVLMSRALATVLDDGRRRLLSAGALATPARWVAVDHATAMIVPVPRRLAVSPEILASLDGEADDPLEGRLRVTEPVQPQMVMTFVADGPVLTPVSRGVALLHLATGTINFPQVGPESLRTVKRLVAGTEACSQLAMASPAEMVRAFRQGVDEAFGPSGVPAGPRLLVSADAR